MVYLEKYFKEVNEKDFRQMAQEYCDYVQTGILSDGELRKLIKIVQEFEKLDQTLVMSAVLHAFYHEMALRLS